MIFKRLTPFLLILLVPLAVYGQTRQDVSEKELSEQLKEQNRRIEELEKLIEKLDSAIEREARENEMQNLLEEARRLAARKNGEKISPDERKFYSGLRQHAALNPNISVGGDFYFAYGSSESEYNRVPSEINFGTGGLFMREMELSFESVLDPYSRGKLFLGFGADEVGVEEGYLEWLNWPLDMNVKLGKFKPQFGVINRYHNHAMPQFERPFVMANYFTQESLKGVGVGANFLLPSLTAHVNELDLQVVSGGEGLSFTNGGKYNLVYIAHLKNYWDLNRSTYVELGLSGALGHNDPDEEHLTTIGGVDFRLKWSPPDRAKYRGVEWWTEALLSRRDMPDGSIDTWGIFSSIQCRLGARWMCSVRLDYSQLPFDDSREEYGGAFCLDYWQSEFVFVRFQYTHVERNFDEDDHRMILQTNWAMGPHKHEAY